MAVQYSRKITGLYYITHIENIPSILRHGILSHQEVQRRDISYKPIYDERIVSRREKILSPEGKSLWNYANLYFQARNPMLFRVVEETDISTIAVVRVRRDLLKRPDILLTTGNAAHAASEIVPFDNQVLKEIARFLDLEYWNETDGTKRKIMAECLVPDQVEPDWIEAIYVANDEAAGHVRKLITGHTASIDVIPDPHMFFRPDWQKYITRNLAIAKGDMFFSRMQTLTISVNIVGVMGKGLASRAKFQFPDVYVNYQTLCKKGVLEVGKPFLITRETSLSSELSEVPLDNGSSTWFLLFPTKKHWREDSRLEYILDGMRWLRDHYQQWKIKSLALPALGCGLGKLDWQTVGPVICSIAGRFSIPVCVYLPTEKIIPPELLTREFLLRQDIT